LASGEDELFGFFYKVDRKNRWFGIAALKTLKMLVTKFQQAWKI